jgi:hypothetical protein
MRTGMVLLGLCGLALPLGARAGEAGKKDPAAVREIDLKGYRGDAKGDVRKPTAITSAEELAKAFPDKEWQERIAKQVDFGKEKLLLFRWAGSGGDRISPAAGKGDKAPVVFHYRAGLTDDLRRHFRLFAIPKDATWRVEPKQGE